ncbi:uncharacterized protein LOC128558374 [Mercenaria mercenaria]|uniref:uncharacterized protein LOC128558374 n=1 Tax=Mercenaria mercenaria TaxID=6596 RepID=UPI00234F5A08|nr:uncharacterized protein LOC128558374 [Mercenaria mercenaria]
MTTTENEYFLRITYLLLKGGTFILGKVLHREVQKNGGDIDVSLQAFRKKLHHELHKKQFDKVFASGGTNIQVWDIAIYINVLTIVFRNTLTDAERRSIRSMLHLRNETYAHIPNALLPYEKYEDCREELEDAINELSSSLDATVQSACTSIIKECIYQPLDTKNPIENLKQFNDDLARLVIGKIDSSQKQLSSELASTERKLEGEISAAKDEIIQHTDDLQEKVIDAIKRAINGKRTMKTVKVVDTELTLNGDEENWVKLAERIILRVTDEAIRKTGGATEFVLIENAVQELLDEINSNEDTEVQGVHEGSIHLRIRCTTYEALLDLLMYMDSPSLQQRLDALSFAVTEIFNLQQPIKVSAKLSYGHILQSISDDLEDTKVAKRTVRLPIRCTSYKGLEHVWNLFANGEASNKMNKISETISRHLGTKITIKASIDVKQFERVLEEEEPLLDEKEVSSSSATESDWSWDEEWDNTDIRTIRKGIPTPLTRHNMEQENTEILRQMSDICMFSDPKAPDVILVIGDSRSGKSSFIYTLQASLTGAIHQFASVKTARPDSYKITWYKHLGVSLTDVPLKYSDNWEALKNIRPHLPHVVECTGLENLDKATQQDILDRFIAGYVSPGTNVETLERQRLSWLREVHGLIGLFTGKWRVSKVVFVQNVLDGLNNDLFISAVRALTKGDWINWNTDHRLERDLIFLLTNCDREKDPHQLGEKKRRSDETAALIQTGLKSLGHGSKNFMTTRWANLNADNRFQDPQIRNQSLKWINSMISISPDDYKHAILLQILLFLLVIAGVFLIVAIHVNDMPKKLVLFTDVVLIIGVFAWANRAYNRLKKIKLD